MPHSRVFLLFLWLASAILAQPAAPHQTAILTAVESQAPGAIALLERIVGINSGTFNLSGVKAVADVLEPEFRALGFSTRRIPMDAVKRASHLVAERKGSGGKAILLIGHMDTVFEPSSPFQRFTRTATSATGPGINDMKGGIAVMLLALKGLHKAGLLEAVSITVFLTADEEAPGDPVSVTRGDLILAGKNAKAALCFEPGVRDGNKEFASTARRGFAGWEIRITGTPGHSGSVFSERLGHGAIFELSRILSQFHQQLPEPDMTFNVGIVLGGADIRTGAAGSGSVSGKPNIVPAEALARGEVRALSPDQLARIKDKMHGIVARGLPKTSASITFEEGYPPMAPTAGNRRLLALLNEGSRAAGLPELGELDPMLRGAGDISFIAPYVDSLTGLGIIGGGSHAPGERADLESIARQAKRAALLIHRLSQ